MSDPARRPTTIARRNGRGQSLVEFALVFPVFLVMLFGVIDAGRLIYMNSVLSQAAREGARLAAVEASWLASGDSSCGATGGPVCPANVTALKGDVLAAANRMVSPFGSISATSLFLRCDMAGSAPTGSGWTGVSCSSHAPNNVVSVRVEMPYAPLTPVLGQLLGMNMSGSATMVIN